MDVPTEHEGRESAVDDGAEEGFVGWVAVEGDEEDLLPGRYRDGQLTTMTDRGLRSESGKKG